MIELITGAVLTLISLLIGFHLGKNQTVVTADVNKKIQQIFRKVVPNPDVGPIVRPTQQDNYYRDNPQAKLEDDVMNDTFTKLND